MNQFTPERITEQVCQANKEYYFLKELRQTRELFNKVCKDNPDMTRKVRAVLTGKAKVIEAE